MIYGNTSGLKAILDWILWFVILLDFFLRELIFGDKVPSAKYAKIKPHKIKALHCIMMQMKSFLQSFESKHEMNSV